MNSDKIKKREIFFVMLVMVSILFTGFVVPIKALSWSSDNKITLEEIKTTLYLQDLNISDSELEEILSYSKISGEKTTLRQAAEIVVLNRLLLQNHMVEFMSQLSHTILDVKKLIYIRLPIKIIKWLEWIELIKTVFNAFNIIKGIDNARMQNSVKCLSLTFTSSELAEYLDRSLDTSRKNKIKNFCLLREGPAIKPYKDKIVQMAKMRKIAMDNEGEINALQHSITGIIRDRVNKKIADRIPVPPATDISPTAITISPTTTIVDIGRIPQFTLSVYPVNADQRVIWSVGDTTIGIIDINGFFTAKKIGMTTITATSVANKNITGTATVTVVGPDIKISPTTPIEVILWQGEHTTRTIEVKNVGGGGTLWWGVTDDRGWIDAIEALRPGCALAGTREESRGMTDYRETDKVSVTIDTRIAEGLAVGVYTGTIIFTQIGGAEEVIKIPIILEVRAVDMEVSPATPIDLTLWQGQQVIRTINVKNVGGIGTLWWNVTDDKDWIILSEWVKVSPWWAWWPMWGWRDTTGGITTTETDEIRITINTNGLSVGTHTGTIIFTQIGGAEEVIKIPVTLEVKAADMEVSPATPIEVILWQGEHTTRMIKVTNVSGGGTLHWGVTDDKDWIILSEWVKVSPWWAWWPMWGWRDTTGGITTTETDEIRITINTNGLAVGTHTGTIIFTQIGRAEETIKIPVTLTIPRPAPIAIGISLTKTEIDVNTTKQFAINVTPTDADQSVIWSVDNEGMGTIDKNGIFTAVGPGFVTITATSVVNPAISGTAIITVTKPVVKPPVPEPERKKEEGREWREGETKTWKTPKNWVPGGIISNTLHLKNSGNINAVRTTIHIATGIINAPKIRVNDGRVLDRTDMDTQIRITKATFGGVNVNDLIGKTLYQLRGDTIELGSGIGAGAEKSLFLEFKFDCEGKKCAGYMGDKVRTNFTFGLHQR